MDIDLKTLKTQQDWLTFMAKIGDEAKRILSTTAIDPLEWSELESDFFRRAFPPVPSTSQIDYSRWLSFLRKFAVKHNIPSPSEMTAANAGDLAAMLVAEKISPMRRFRFYKRVWRTIGLDSLIWNTPLSLVNVNSEHYRRLSAEEIANLVACARSEDDEAADMIEIGYWTGLRLSDVAQLERSEIRPDVDALFLVPNKIRTRKPYPISIPLVGNALSIVRRRLSSLKPNKRFLFPDEYLHRPSRRMSRLFAEAKIEKKGNGRASFHSLRATFISLMDEAGIQPYITDAITGHSNGGMHARYTQPSLEALRNAVTRAIPQIDYSLARTCCPGPRVNPGQRRRRQAFAREDRSVSIL
jgi:integrase